MNLFKKNRKNNHKEKAPLTVHEISNSRDASLHEEQGENIDFRRLAGLSKKEIVQLYKKKSEREIIIH